MRKPLSLAAYASVSTISLLAALPALAQEGQTQSEANAPAQATALQEIVVTAQKRAQNLQDVPIAITAVEPERLESAGITKMQDLSAAVPGLQILNIAGNLTPRIRGIGAGFTSVGVESPVATYLDDVYYSYGADISFDVADVSQVTVLKGPQGTLFGRNATGGVLQVTTRGPSQDFGGSIGVSFDNYLTAKVNGFVTGGLSDQVAASLSASYTHQGKGYGKNIATGNDIYKIDKSVALRGKIRADIGDSTTILMSADYNERSGPQAAVFRPFPGWNISNPAPTYPTRAWDANNFADPENDYSGGGGSVTLTHDFGFAEFKSVTAYRDSQSRYFFINQPSSLITRTFIVEEDSNQFTQEVQLVSPSRGPLTWAIGAFYIQADADAVTTVNFLDPVTAATTLQVFVPGSQKTESLAGFAQATYEILPTTRLTGGIRYTWEKKKFVGQPDYTFEKPTWRLSLDHDFADGILGYISYNRGVKSGGFSIRAPGSAPFEPEKLDAYEAGIKTELMDRTVRLNLAGFYYDYQNIQVTQYVPAGTGTAILNGAAAELYGIDAEIEARLSDTVRVFGGANWLHAEYSDFRNAPINTPVPGPGGSFTNTVAPGDATGNDLSYAPHFTYTLGVDLTVPTSAGEVVFNVTDAYNSGFYSEPDNRLKQGSYHLLNASIRWTSEDEKYTARLFVNNILDEAVASQFLSFAAGFIGDYSNPPRVIGGSFQVKF